MRASVIQSIGMLDGAGLVRGYGEEVDWCLRASAAGYRHLCATGAFVAHTGTVSFRFEKNLRVRQNHNVLAARYPRYYPQYHEFVRADPLADARAALRLALEQTTCHWLTNAIALVDGELDVTRALPAALPSSCLRIAVWQHRLSSPAAGKILTLARQIANRPPAAPPLRLLIIGEASEALWHTGVVDVLPSGTWQEATLLTDAALVGLGGCSALLAENMQALPEGIPGTRIDDAFEPHVWLSNWLANWLAQHAKPSPPTRHSPRERQTA
jgi:hypothetical protein